MRMRIGFNLMDLGRKWKIGFLVRLGSRIVKKAINDKT
jgi:hypothetical protein